MGLKAKILGAFKLLSVDEARAEQEAALDALELEPSEEAAERVRRAGQALEVAKARAAHLARKEAAEARAKADAERAAKEKRLDEVLAWFDGGFHDEARTAMTEVPAAVVALERANQARGELRSKAARLLAEARGLSRELGREEEDGFDRHPRHLADGASNVFNAAGMIAREMWSDALERAFGRRYMRGGDLLIIGPAAPHREA